MKKLREVSLLDLLPESVLLDEQLKSAAKALDVQIQKVTSEIRQVLHLPRLDELSGDILDYLMEQFHVDFAEPLYLNEDAKRNLIRESIAWHRIKGTPAAIEKIARDAFRDAQVVEWFDYGGEPYHFKIRSHGFLWTPDGWQTYLRMIEAAKNVRSWCDNYELYLDGDDFGQAKAYAGVANLITGSKTVQLARPKFERSAQVYAGTVDFISGDVSTDLRRPKLDFKSRMHAGMLLSKVGNVSIGSKTKSLIDETDFTRSWKSEIFAGMSNLIVGRKFWSIALPRNLQTKIFAGSTQFIDGEVKKPPSTPKNQRAEIFAGSAEIVTGNVSVGSKTQSTGDENHFAKSFKSDVTTGNVEVVSGAITVKDGFMTPKFATVAHVGNVTRVTGEITIGCSDVKDWGELPIEGDWIRLRFKFPHLRKRFVTLKNPRDNLVKNDVREVGDLAADTKILRNSAGDYTTGIDLAMLIKRSERKIL